MIRFSAHGFINAKFPPDKGWNIITINHFFELKDWITKSLWSPIVFKNGVRNSESFLLANILALDFDEIKTINEIDLKLKKLQYTFIIGTTKSHQLLKNGVICDRFRVLIKLFSPILDKNDYVFTLKSFAKNMQSDLAACDSARAFFPCKEIVTFFEGTNYPKKIEAPIQLIKPIIHAPLEHFEIEEINSLQIKVGTRNISCFKIAIKLFKRGLDKNTITNIILQIPMFKNSDEAHKKAYVKTINSAYKYFIKSRTKD